MASNKMIGSGTPSIQSRIPRPMMCIPLLLFIGVFYRLLREKQCSHSQPVTIPRSIHWV
jgi:hypothetical protein